MFYKEGIKLSPAELSMIGNLARDHTTNESVVHVEVTRNLNQPAALYGNRDSCWWSNYRYSRCWLKEHGGLALRTFSSDKKTLIEGASAVESRAWVLPVEKEITGSGDGLRPTHETMSPDGYLVFNSYGVPLRQQAKLVSLMTGKSYRSVDFKASDVYVNNNLAILVASEATCEAFGEVVLHLDSHCFVTSRQCR
jgi:hypothetical protein